MSQPARERLVNSAIELFRQKGIAGTPIQEIIDHSGAGRGSMYTHFPGGKADLAEEAIRTAGAASIEMIAMMTAEHDPVAALGLFVDFWRDSLRDSGYTDGCPILPGALQDDQSPAARTAAGQIFQEWQDRLADTMCRHGADPDRARTAATLAVAAIEGAVALARAQHSTTPIDHVETELLRLARDLLPKPEADRT